MSVLTKLHLLIFKGLTGQEGAILNLMVWINGISLECCRLRWNFQMLLLLVSSLFPINEKMRH